MDPLESVGIPHVNNEAWMLRGRLRGGYMERGSSGMAGPRLCLPILVCYLPLPMVAMRSPTQSVYAPMKEVDLMDNRQYSNGASSSSSMKSVTSKDPSQIPKHFLNPANVRSPHSKVMQGVSAKSWGGKSKQHTP